MWIFILTKAKINEALANAYGGGTIEGTLKVCRKCGTATIKVRLRSTELVRSGKSYFNRT